MNLYVYVDYGKARRVVFMYRAPSITVADAAYRRKTGKRPSDQFNIGCQIGTSLMDW